MWEGSCDSRASLVSGMVFRSSHSPTFTSFCTAGASVRPSRFVGSLLSISSKMDHSSPFAFLRTETMATLTQHEPQSKEPKLRMPHLRGGGGDERLGLPLFRSCGGASCASAGSTPSNSFSNELNERRLHISSRVSAELSSLFWAVGVCKNFVYL